VSPLVQRIESAGDTQWAKQCDVPIAFGTDLWGPEAQRSQLREFEIRATLGSAERIVRSATATNAELLMQSLRPLIPATSGPVVILGQLDLDCPSAAEPLSDRQPAGAADRQQADMAARRPRPLTAHR